MEEQFVPYELALKLKELGFDKKCFGWWSYINGTAANFYGYHCTNSELIELNSFNKNCTAPLWQQAFDWFRDEHNLFAEFSRNTLRKKYDWCIPVNIHKGYCSHEEYSTYEEARLECLKKLIEL